jgi:type IV pilus assembly protein PilQ
MIVQTMAAVLTVALVQAAAPVAALRPVPGAAISPTPAQGTSAVAARGRGAATTVTGVSLLSGTAGAELVVGVEGASVSVRDFTLANPSRIVLDVIGARLAVKPRAYDRTARGAIRDVRVAQFATDTVRVVVELAGRQRYTVRQAGGEVRLAIAGTAQFARWDMVPGGFAPAATVALATPPTVAPATPSATSLAAQTTGLPDVVPAATPESAAPAPAPVAALVVPAPVPEIPASTLSAPAAPAAGPDTPVLAATTVARDERAGRLAPTAPSFSSADVPARVELPLAPPAAPAAPAAAQPQPKPAPQARIRVNFDGTDIRDVIATFAAFAGRSIVVGKMVQGLVTAEITDKPWDVALQAVLSAQGLAATEDPSGIITVDSYSALAQNQALEPLVTQIVNVNYAKAVSLVPTVRALLARDCSNLTTMQAGRDMGMAGQAGMMGTAGGGQQRGQANALDNQGCVLRGSVTADSATNKLIISEVPTRLPELIKRLQELDVRTPQVAIKAKIIFINRTGIQDIGLAYDLGTGTRQFFQQLVPRIDPNTLQPIDTNGDGVPDSRGGGTPFMGPARIALGGNAISGIANANNAIKPNALNLIYSTALGKYQLTAFLNALQTSALADVQSEPSVTILNNRTAEIFVGQEIPIRVIDASAGGVGGAGGGGGGGGGGVGGAGGQVQPNAQTFFPRASVQIKEAGIRLSVTPQVTNNRMVLLNIKAENSNAEVGPSDVGIIFNQQRAESQVLVADGEAAVIGGLTVTEVSRFRSGIPLLMNIPFAGRLFSQNTTNETKRDLLILVTPHILEGGETLPPSR